MKLSKLFIAMGGAILPITTVLAAAPADVDARWNQPPTVTHPDHAFYPNPDANIQAKRKNIFDWRTQSLQVGMSELHGADELKVSPFYICEVESLYNIPGGKKLTDDIMRPDNSPTPSCSKAIFKSISEKEPDMNPDYGWEILKFNLGYKMEHYKNAKSEWSADGADAFSTNQIPYMIFYNRITGKLRVMAYFPNSDIGTGMGVTLSTDNKAKIFDNGQSSDNQLFSKSTMGLGAINNVMDGGWGVADFNMALDPCVPNGDNILNVKIQPKVTSDIELYGHSVGHTQNVTNENIGNPKDYLMDVSGNLDQNLEQAGNYTLDSQQDLNNLFSGINDSSTAFAVASDALDAAGTFLGVMMDIAPGGMISTGVETGLTALSGVLGGTGSIMGTQAAAVSGYSPIMPQISFSEIYLRGTSTTQDNGVTFKIRLPGSKNTIWENDLEENAAVGTASYPLYDEPMGLFTLLASPQVRVQKDYASLTDSGGYKLTTTFIPYNVAFASNEKAGIEFSVWGPSQKKDDAVVTGRLKVKYIVDANVTPVFTNLHDIDGDDNDYAYIPSNTNGRDTKIYTVITDEVNLGTLNSRLSGVKAPSISINGGTALVDNVSLVVMAKNSSAVLRDHILNENIDMINKTDANGVFVPYYIASKSYPARLTYNKDPIQPDEDIKRLIDSGQVTNADYFPGTGIQVALGRNETGISGYCSADGEYNKPYVPVNTDTTPAFSLFADEDMSYYAYKPKQVSRAELDTTTLKEDQCGGCANSRTWPFVSFNLREYMEKYGGAIPKKVVVRFVQNYPMQLSDSLLSLYDYSSGYYFSANKSTPNMVATDWQDDEPSGSSFIGDFSMNGNVIKMDVTEQFKTALSRVKDSPSGKYELPRLPLVISFGSDSQSVKNVYDIDSSNKGATGPRLDVYF